MSATPSKLQLIGRDGQEDKSKAVAKEKSYKATFRIRCSISLCRFSHCPQRLEDQRFVRIMSSAALLLQVALAIVKLLSLFLGNWPVKEDKPLKGSTPLPTSPIAWGTRKRSGSWKMVLADLLRVCNTKQVSADSL